MPWRGLLDLLDQCDRLVADIDRHFTTDQRRSGREQRHRLQSLRLTIYECRRRLERADHVTPTEAPAPEIPPDGTEP